MRALMVVRLLLVADAIVMTAIGALALAFVDRPAGPVGAVVCWGLAGGLLGLLPLTDPYRTPRRGRHR